jgi:hypothetical protein
MSGGAGHLKAAAREVGAIVAAFGVWTGLSLLIVVFAWRFSSVWWFVLLSVYTPAPIAMFLYALLIRPRTPGKRAKRALLLAMLGWFLSNPLPLCPVFNQIVKVFLHFHPILPPGEDPLMGVWIGSICSFWLIGIWYCAYSGHYAGRLADVLPARGARSPSPTSTM